MNEMLEAAGVRNSERNHIAASDPTEYIRVAVPRSIVHRLRAIAKQRNTRITTLIRSGLTEKLIEWEEAAC